MDEDWKEMLQNGPIEPRYMHATGYLNAKIYVIGGLSLDNGQLSDTKVFSTDGRALWSDGPPCPIPCFGHGVVTRERFVIVIGGSDCGPEFPVFELNTRTSNWSRRTTSGQAPVAKRGHSVSLLGTKVVFFGGETVEGCLQNDVYVLNLDGMVWERVVTRGPCPSPRSGHGAFVANDRDVYVFGGRTLSACHNDLYLLNTETMQWTLCSQCGSVPSPRAFFACTGFEGKWFITGGADFTKGLAETYVLNVETLCWNRFQTSQEPPELACVGLSLVSFKLRSLSYIMYAFGGHDGKSINRKMFNTLVGCELDESVPSLEDTYYLKEGAVEESTCMLQLRMVPEDWCHYMLVETAGITFPPCEQLITPRQEVDVDDIQEPMLAYLKKLVIKQGLEWFDQNMRVDVRPNSRHSLPCSFEPTAVAGRWYPSLSHLVFWVNDKVDEDFRWQGYVVLFLANMLSEGSSVNPVLVTTDLRDEWSFAWMKGFAIFDLRSVQMPKALGFIKDVARPCRWGPSGSPLVPERLPLHIVQIEEGP